MEEIKDLLIFFFVFFCFFPLFTTLVCSSSLKARRTRTHELLFSIFRHEGWAGITRGESFVFCSKIMNAYPWVSDAGITNDIKQG
jgi:ABC-type maltose transport system permease subunit